MIATSEKLGSGRWRTAPYLKGSGLCRYYSVIQQHGRRKAARSLRNVATPDCTKFLVIRPQYKEYEKLRIEGKSTVLHGHFDYFTVSLKLTKCFLT